MVVLLATSRCRRGLAVVGSVLVAAITMGATPIRSAKPTPTPAPEPPPAFGRVVYRASKAAAYESLGVPVIACRHRDRQPRRIAVEFFDQLGKKVLVFGPSVIGDVPAGRKVVFVSDAMYFPNRDVINVGVAHFTNGTARVLSDARVIHCRGKMRFDPGATIPSYTRSVGLYRPDAGGTPVPVDW